MNIRSQISPKMPAVNTNISLFDLTNQLSADVLDSNEFGFFSSISNSSGSGRSEKSPTSSGTDSSKAWAKSEDTTGDSGVDRKLFDARALFKVFLSRVAMHLDRKSLRILHNCIDSVLDEEEWDPDDKIPTENSFRTLIRMLLLLKVAHWPGLGVSNSGTVVASWANGPNRLTIDCLENDWVRFVIAAPSGDRTERTASECHIQRLTTLLAPHSPQKWFANGG